MAKRLFVFMKHGEKPRTLVHFLQKKKSYEPCSNKEVYCLKYLNFVKGSHCSVCGLVG